VCETKHFHKVKKKKKKKKKTEKKKKKKKKISSTGLLCCNQGKPDEKCLFVNKLKRRFEIAIGQHQRPAAIPVGHNVERRHGAARLAAAASHSSIRKRRNACFSVFFLSSARWLCPLRRLRRAACALLAAQALLKWRGWAYNPPRPLSRFYLGVVGVLGGSKPTLWELEPTLPNLPVPDLAHTCQLYLASVEPLLTPTSLPRPSASSPSSRRRRRRRAAAGAPAAARRSERNWLIQWWEEFVYLRSRMPIAIFSNWYGLDRVEAIVQTPVARAANVVNRALLFHQMIDSRRLEPNRVQGTIPLSMFTYSRMFGTVRVPGLAQDQLVVHNSHHIVVM
jgi:hypothetical protein